MLPRWLISVLIIAWAGSAFVHATDNDRALSQQYLALYTRINEADQAERHHDYAKAIRIFQDGYAGFAKIHDEHPDWESAVVIHRLDDCQSEILYLQDEVKDFSAAPQFIHLHSGPKNIYPWKKDILPSTFWIGESAASAWDQHWTQSNGGSDPPDKRNGYTSAKHSSDLNPFYVALPFNDLAFPDKAQKWLPAGWTRATTDGAPVSACQNRWVEIKNAHGDVCYAQWEDVGPGRADDAEYVFGNQPPQSHNGICISPAVADYLNNQDNTPVRWRFVDAQDVQPGAWLKYDEEAVLFRAMHSLGPQKPLPVML